MSRWLQCLPHRHTSIACWLNENETGLTIGQPRLLVYFFLPKSQERIPGFFVFCSFATGLLSS